jgi:lipopolysaccharide cholinephosphotransferase
MDKKLVSMREEIDKLSSASQTVSNRMDEISTEIRGSLSEIKTKIESHNQLIKTSTDITRLPQANGVRRDVQTILVDMLDEVERVCEKYDLNYWLDFGTLLGAVRHQGIIPWDDDMDIAMISTDYEKFAKVIEKELEETNFRFINVPSQIGKIVHKDFMPDGEEETAKFIHWALEDKLSFALDIFPYYYTKKELTNETVATLLDESCLKKRRSFKDRTNYADFRQSAEIVHDGNATIKSGVVSDTLALGLEAMVYQPRIISRKGLLPLTEVDFEGKKRPAPKKYREYLVDLYGDYMQLPDHPHTHLFLSKISKNEMILLKQARKD